MKAKLHYVFSIAIFLTVFSVFAQNSSFKKLEATKNTNVISKSKLDVSKVQMFELNMTMFKSALLNVNSRNEKTNKKVTLISIPSENGNLETFHVFEAPVLSPELATLYPEIKSYVGLSTENPGTRLRMSVSPQGVQTMISYLDKPTVFMEPASPGASQYLLYTRKSKNSKNNRFSCKTIDDFTQLISKNNLISKVTVNEGGANNKTLQKFRIAISVTGEYTAFHGGTVPGALAAINATLTRVNEVFETDMAVTFQLVNATQLIYTNASTDPYSDATIGSDEANFDNTNGWSLQLQNNLTTTIGNAAYDIGHLFGASGGGGIAGCIGCVCSDDSASTTDHNKGSGFTSPSNGVPQGDSFDLDFVAHEIGHQMGANHTFAFTTEGTGVNSEPGNGSTIMGYAGTGGSDEIQIHSDPYFHYHSIKQILANLATKSCQTTQAITNNPPIANAGNNYAIPRGTAYILKGIPAIAEGGDVLSYCWEQIDDGAVNYLNFGPGLTIGSMNRSLPPSSSPNRYIPKLNSVLAGKTTQSNPTLGSDWETVSTVARTLNWALTVRDRSTSNPIGGQSSYDTMSINVENVTPFTMSNPVNWTQGSTVNINWVVGQTTNATINCQNVNIKLSTDGGATFPITIAANTPNDGVHSYTVPALPNSSTARLLIEAADNIFYDVSNYNFSISTAPDFFIVEETLNPISCGQTTATFNFNYVVANGFNETTVFSATGNPSGSNVTFSPASLNTSGTVTMTISNLAGVPLGDYPITITGTAPSKTKNKIVNFPFYNGNCSSIANTTYATSTTGVTFNTINNLNNGKPSGYSNYTSLSTNVNRNSSYNLTVRVNTDGNYTTSTKVWIDWNQNCSFNDAGEEYNLGDATNVANGITNLSPRSITIPLTATLGNTVMRVSTKYKDDGAPTACENGFDGEVEDYRLNIIPTLAVETYGFDNFIVWPNPNKGVFNIQLQGSLERQIKVNVFDIRGREIYNHTFENVGDFKQEIQLNNLQLGMYLLIVTDGVRKSTKKIVVE